MHWVNAIAHRHRQQQRHHDHQGGKYVQHGPKHQQQNIQQNQKAEGILNVLVNKHQQLLWHLGVHQEVGKGKGDAQNQQNTPDHDHGLHRNLGELPPSHFFVEQNLGHDHIGRSHRRRF